MTRHWVTGRFDPAVIGGAWSIQSDLFARNMFTIALIVIALAIHRFDDHVRVRLFARRTRPEIFWSLVILLWVLAIVLSQGSSDKFIYFDF